MQVIFDYPNEILTHITGTFGPAMIMGPQVIKSLTFHTTKGKHGPFGEEQGGSFSTKVKEGRIVGFHGRKGLFLDAIGVHLLEGKVMPAVVDTPNSKTMVTVSDPHHKSGISEIDHFQWPNKLVLAKRGPAPEEVINLEYSFHKSRIKEKKKKT